MGNINKANRECADVDIRVLKTMKPFLFFDTANVVGLELNSDDTYATAKGTRRISFSNPVEADMTIEAQIMPLKLISMISDGEIETTAELAERKTVESTGAGTITVPENIKAGTLFVFKEGDFGGEAIEGSLEGTTFTATRTEDIAESTSYEIGYIVTKASGVHKVAINNKKNPQDYYITMLTNDKDEEGNITAKKITVYKAKPKKTLSLSYSSDSDPISIKLELTALENKDGEQIDIVEIDE